MSRFTRPGPEEVSDAKIIVMFRVVACFDILAEKRSPKKQKCGIDFVGVRTIFVFSKKSSNIYHLHNIDFKLIIYGFKRGKAY